MNNLPAFQDSRLLGIYMGSPSNDGLQAIVPALNFTCAGRVTEWRTCVDPQSMMARYYIQFQVWRSTGVQGCYTLVGFNAPSLGAGGAVDVNLLLESTDGCVVLPVAENEQFEFQPGDVIGYYADRYNSSGSDPSDGGVQVLLDDNAVFFQAVGVPLSDLKSEYAISLLGADHASCGINISLSTSVLYDLPMVMSGAPVLSMTIGMKSLIK